MVSEPACQPLAICPPVILTLLHNDKLGLLQRLSSAGGHASGLQGHSCLHRISRQPTISVHNGNTSTKLKSLPKIMHSFVSLCVLSMAFTEVCSSVYRVRMHLAFSAQTFNLSRKTAQAVRKIQEESKVYSYFRPSLPINYHPFCHKQHPIQYFCSCYNRWRVFFPV